VDSQGTAGSAPGWVHNLNPGHSLSAVVPKLLHLHILPSVLALPSVGGFAHGSQPVPGLYQGRSTVVTVEAAQAQAVSVFEPAARGVEVCVVCGVSYEVECARVALHFAALPGSNLQTGNMWLQSLPVVAPLLHMQPAHPPQVDV
jgi:hypothetical protein